MFNIFSRRREPQPLFFETDIHCHVLPGIDDGSPDVDTSVQLVENMQKWGVKRIIASPHVTFGTFPNTPQTADDAMQTLQQALTERGNPLVLMHSAENRIDDMLLENMENDTLMTLPGDLILIENSFIQEPWTIDQIVFQLQLKGLTPILAHPERYSYYYARKDRYRKLHDLGLQFQVNVLSLAGAYGRDEKQMAEYLIEQNLVDYLGTDIHCQKHIEIIETYLASKDYLKHRDALKNRILNDKI